VNQRTESKIEARKRELLVMYGRVHSALDDLAIQNAAAMALFEALRNEFGNQNTAIHFVPVHFTGGPTPKAAQEWMKKMDRLLFGSSAPLRDPSPRQQPVATPTYATVGKSISAESTSPRHTLPLGELLTAKQVRIFFGGICPATLYRGMKKGTYPKQIKLGSHLSRWLRRECEETILRLAEGRGPQKLDFRPNQLTGRSSSPTDATSLSCPKHPIRKGVL
jgi:predicted DNA-binding transcriptional regulator AlpA